MEVFLNNRQIIVEEDLFLLELLNNNGFISFKGMAVAVNNKVVPKKDMESFRLKNNDNILVIKAVCGG